MQELGRVELAVPVATAVGLVGAHPLALGLDLVEESLELIGLIEAKSVGEQVGEALCPLDPRVVLLDPAQVVEQALLGEDRERPRCPFLPAWGGVGIAPLLGRRVLRPRIDEQVDSGAVLLRVVQRAPGGDHAPKRL